MGFILSIALYGARRVRIKYPASVWALLHRDCRCISWIPFILYSVLFGWALACGGVLDIRLWRLPGMPPLRLLLQAACTAQPIRPSSLHIHSASPRGPSSPFPLHYRICNTGASHSRLQVHTGLHSPLRIGRCGKRHLEHRPLRVIGGCYRKDIFVPARLPGVSRWLHSTVGSARSMGR